MIQASSIGNPRAPSHTKFGGRCLGILTAIQTNYAKRGGAIKLCRVAAEDRRILEITKLESIFEVYATEDEAVSSFEMAPVPGKPS